MPKIPTEERVSIEDLIAKKRDEIIADLREATKGTEERIIEEAEAKFNAFVEQLKEAYSAKVVGPEDLLRVMGNGGFVYRGIIDTNELGYDEIEVRRFIERTGESHKLPTYGTNLRGKQRVTIIIEPVDED